MAATIGRRQHADNLLSTRRLRPCRGHGEVVETRALLRGDGLGAMWVNVRARGTAAL
jgi:hypothetical protein